MGTKVCSNGPGHMTKMATMPIYGQNPLKIFLQNQKADDLGTWYAAWGCGAFQVCSNDPSLTYLTSRSNLLPNAFKWGKNEK